MNYGEFRIYYQPIISFATHQMVAVEALLRWPHPDATFTPPDQFIPQAESSGFIIQLGDWVLRTATEQVARWHATFGYPVRLAVNLSNRQFLHFNLVANIESALRHSKLDPRHLELEITEGAAMHSPDEAIGIMRQLRNLGIRLSLDDFGTGYSSLSYLKRLPIDKLKIDKSFVCDIPADANDLAIVTAIIAMGHALGLEVLAEGVETEAQAQFLAECSCDYAQGFLYGRPVPAEDLERLLQERPAPA